MKEPSRVAAHSRKGVITPAPLVERRTDVGAAVFQAAGTDPWGVIATLTVSDTATRVREMKRLQAQQGNRYVQGLVTRGVRMPAAQAKGNPEVYNVDLETPTGAGHPIPAEVRHKMQQAFSIDFSDVRVHEDGEADRLGAKAFTVGNDIHFSSGTYDPRSVSGQELLGHELTHVSQQRAGRVSAPGGPGNTAVVQDPDLESEADARGVQATRGDTPSSPAHCDGEHSPGEPAQRKGIVQSNGRPHVPISQGVRRSFMDLSASGAMNVLSTVAGGVATGVQAASNLQPGTTGVASFNFEPMKMTEADREGLKLIAQARLMNRYADYYVSSHPDVAQPPTTTPAAPAPAAPGPAPVGGVPSATPAPAPAPSPTGEGGPMANESPIDESIRVAVEAEVARAMQQTLNQNQKTAPRQTYLWTDDDAHDEPDWIGTTGEVQFTDVKGTFLKETPTRNGNAQRLALFMPSEGTEVMVTQFRGGQFGQGPRMETGLNDDLSVNIRGSQPTFDDSANAGHGMLTFFTEWNWDDNQTQWVIDIKVDANSGMPEITDRGPVGEAES